MKKLLISIGTLLIMACVVILFVNAEGSKKDPKKAKTETVTTPCQAAGGQQAAEKAGACDPATCAGHQTDGQKKTEGTDPVAPCAATCGSKAPVKK